MADDNERGQMLYQSMKELHETAEKKKENLTVDDLPAAYRNIVPQPSKDEILILQTFSTMPPNEQKLFLEIWDLYTDKEKVQSREEEFLKSPEYQAILKVYPRLNLQPGTKELEFMIGIVESAVKLTFPILFFAAENGLTFQEAFDKDPESINPYSVEGITALLWDNYYMPLHRKDKGGSNSEKPADKQEAGKRTPAPADPGAAAADGELERIIIKRPDNVEYPLDKLNSSIWQLLEGANGQYTFAMEAKRGSKNTRQTLDCIYSIDFSAMEQEGVKITRRLTPFDKRVYIAVAALYNMGNDIITLRQIFFAMGQKASNPKGEQLRKINESLTKMTWARITVDDSQEHNRYNYNLNEDGVKNGWRHGKYDGSFLPMERAEAIANGKVTDAAVHLFREPPMLSFAKMRNQITTIDLKLLQSPVNKTDGNLAIEDYLITRIFRARKAGRESEKILFKTLFEKVGITEKKQRARTPEKIEKYLQFYQQEGGLITGYTIERDNVTIYFKGGPAAAADPEPAGKETEPDANI